MSFRIAFRGLICHVEDEDGEARAVLVHAHDHHPVMIVHIDDVLGALKGWTNSPIGLFHFLPLDSALILDAPAISLSVPPVRTGFARHVPSLKDILDKDLDADAKKGKVSHHGVAASLRYGSGSLKPNGCFGAAVTWTGSGGNPPRCVAKEIVYDVVAGDVVRIHDADEAHSVTVREDATLWIANRNVGKHFHEFANLATKASLAREPKEDGMACVNCTPVPQQPDADVECSNTGYP